MNNNEFTGVIIDAGHGGTDPGALGNNLTEKDLNLRAARYMYKRLQELNIPSVIIRDSDETLPKNERIEKVLDAYNNAPNTILISNHINAGGGEGAEIVYALRNDSTLAQMVLDNIGEAGQIKRKIYQRRLPENPSKDYYYIIRETGNTEPLLIEYGFIDNENDAKKLRNNLEQYVEAVVKAIADYIGYDYFPPSLQNNYYIVKAGDTLYSIARQFNTTVSNLKQANNLTSDMLTIGMQLLIPSQNETEVTTYIVKRGDTLYSISSKFNTTVNKIKELNNLDTNTLSIGQTLLIPSTLPPNIDEPTIPPIDEPNLPPIEEPSIQETEIYIVKRGDSLWSIAKNYNTTVDELIRLNNLSTINLQIGDQLLVPKQNNSENKVYIVKKGDTLWSIAKNNNISVDRLKEINSLTSNLLSVGQELLLA